MLPYPVRQSFFCPNRRVCSRQIPHTRKTRAYQVGGVGGRDGAVGLHKGGLELGELLHIGDAHTVVPVDDLGLACDG